jgi:chemosensory pili system protein ChpA (sensor histidine kinase/response regulator)
MSQPDAQPDVLIVDDNVLVCRSLARLLMLSGHASRCVDGGQQAIEFLRTCKPSVVLLDVMMPQVSGFDVLRAIRADARCRNVVVLMYSAVADPAYQAKARELGANDYLVKGDLSFSQLQQLVAAHLSRMATDGPDA